MGTSKSYGSPKWPGVNAAVGGATNDSSKLRGAIRAFASGQQGYIGRGEFSASSGGGAGSGVARRGSGSGSHARSRAASSGANLAGFVSAVQHSGIDSALDQFNLADLRDRPIDEALEVLGQRLSEDGGLLDDEALNRAMAETIDEFATDAESIEDLERVLSGNDLDLEVILQVYYSNYLSANFEQKEYAIVREKLSLEKTEQFFTKARALIRSIVRDELATNRDLSTIDWNGPVGRKIADQINQEVMDILKL